MTNHHGTPIWYELATGTPDAAQDFYGRVMGWGFETPPGGLERGYRIFSASDGEGIGGMVQTSNGASAAPASPAGWMVFFGVDDVDAAARKVKSLGGQIEVEPRDIPGVARFALAVDPQGARFYLMRGMSDGDSTAFAPEKTGHCSWNELTTSDQEAALDFYAGLFGWEKAGAMPMGENMGDYTFIRAGDVRIGAMMDARGVEAGSAWNLAFSVADIDAAKTAIEQGGGTVVYGPMELPDDNGWAMQALDPQGRKVSFSSTRKGGPA